MLTLDPSSATTLGRTLQSRKEGPLTELARGRTATRLEAEQRRTQVAAERERRKTFVAAEQERRATITAVIQASVAGTVISDRDPSGRTLNIKIPAHPADNPRRESS